jgi:hypothetical protein
MSRHEPSPPPPRANGAKTAHQAPFGLAGPEMKLRVEHPNHPESSSLKTLSKLTGYNTAARMTYSIQHNLSYSMSGRQMNVACNYSRILRLKALNFVH